MNSKDYPYTCPQCGSEEVGFEPEGNQPNENLFVCYQCDFTRPRNRNEYN